LSRHAPIIFPPPPPKTSMHSALSYFLFSFSTVRPRSGCHEGSTVRVFFNSFAFFFGNVSGPPCERWTFHFSLPRSPQRPSPRRNLFSNSPFPYRIELSFALFDDASSPVRYLPSCFLLASSTFRAFFQRRRPR